MSPGPVFGAVLDSLCSCNSSSINDDASIADTAAEVVGQSVVPVGEAHLIVADFLQQAG